MTVGVTCRTQRGRLRRMHPFSTRTTVRCADGTVCAEACWSSADAGVGGTWRQVPSNASTLYATGAIWHCTADADSPRTHSPTPYHNGDARVAVTRPAPSSEPTAVSAAQQWRPWLVLVGGEHFFTTTGKKCGMAAACAHDTNS